MRTAAIAPLVLLALPGLASAAPLLDADPALEAKARGYARQQEVFSSRENGLFLDAFIKPADIPLVQGFFAQSAQPDFKAFSGRDAFDTVERFDEYGDEGNFSGVGSVGLAARLILARQTNDPDLARVRDAAVSAARAWHVYGAIGGPGVVARGVRKISGAPQGQLATAGAIPALVPLSDAQGPLPRTKGEAWRAPVAKGFDDWIWLDDTSKDQVSGYALAVAWLWDALSGDPSVPADVTASLAADLAAFAKALMKIAPEKGIDLCIRDADGRLTSFYDVNPRTLGPGGPPLPEDSTLRNGFNAAMALAIVRAAYHVSGDEEIGRWYYEELVGKRDLPALMAANTGLLFIGPPTNFSNANMLAISLALLGRVETDAYVRERLDETLLRQFWLTGDSRDASHAKVAWFDAVYGAYESRAKPLDLEARIRGHLDGMQGAPALQRDRINCDMSEIAAGSCVAVDGKTIIKLATERGWGGQVVADAPLPYALRPDSNFMWRSDPHAVNAGGGNRLNPGGDWIGAYWLARLSDSDSAKNLSPRARAALPYAHGSADAGVDAGAGAAPTSGCSCSTSDAAELPLGALVSLAFVALRFNRARRGGCRRRRA